MKRLLPVLNGKEREVGLRRASLHDFHSFRVTWITLALAASVPLELVQRVTGHTSQTGVEARFQRVRMPRAGR